MTGHLVFSTLHTNDAISTVSRLLDMGAEGFLLASSLQAVMAQRLVRRLCPECHKPHVLDEQEQHWLSQLLGSPTQLPELYQAVGCHQCKDIGYKGRVGVYELLLMSSELTDALQQGNITSFIELATQQQHNKTLASNAVELAKQGITSLDEIIRIAGDLDIAVPPNTTVG
jgi:MSHA biogenesis protein MshE